MFGLVKESRLKELQEKYDNLSLRIKYAEGKESENNQLRAENNKLQIEILSLKNQIREQTEADLFFVSAKIQKKLLDGEPKENVQELRSQQLTYQNALQQQSAFRPPNSFFGGLGSLWGRY